jgi:hypothetical protein
MRDPNRLPDLTSVLVALWLILLPVVTVVVGRRLDKRKSPPREREALRRKPS